MSLLLQNGSMSSSRLVVGVSGASGGIYAQRFLRVVAKLYDEIYLILSDQAAQVAATELNVTIDRRNFSTMEWLGEELSNIRLCGDRDYFTPPASGSFRHGGMVIVPCSMGAIGRIANGISDNLLSRAADVCLKERRKLILVPREMPYNLVMLKNMTALCEAGATILPASPAWYQRPSNLEELADTVVGRILQNLGIEQSITPQWMVNEK